MTDITDITDTTVTIIVAVVSGISVYIYKCETSKTKKIRALFIKSTDNKNGKELQIIMAFYEVFSL